MKVLVIDDDSDVRFVLGEMFRIEGDEALLCYSASEGVNEIARSNPHVVILDVGMPQINGKKVMDWLRETDCPVPIIIISGDDSHRQEALDKGARAFFLKPLPDDFYEQVCQIVEDAKAS